MSCSSQWGEPCSPPFGYCSNASRCVCLQPHVAVGDFAVLPYEDCDLDLLIIKAFWLACGVIHGLSLLVNVLAFIFSNSETSFERKYLALIIFCNLCFTLVGALEGSAAVEGERSIGVDPLTTTIFVLGGSTYWMLLEVLLYVQTKLNPLPLGFQRVQWMRNAHKYSIPLQMATSTTAFLVIFGMIADPANSYTYAAIHYLLLGVLIMVVSLLMVFSMTVIIRDVKRAVKTSNDNHQRLDRVLSVFSNLRAVVLCNMIAACTVSFAFGFSTKLMRKSSYFLPLIWTTTALVFLSHGASAIAVSRHTLGSSHAAETSGERVILSDNQQIILPGRISISTPKSAKRTKRKRKQWKGVGLTKVDEGNLVSSTDDFPGPKSQ